MSSSGGRNSAAAQLREYNPFLYRRHHRSSRTAAEALAAVQRRRKVRRATPARLFSSRRTPTGAAGKLRRQFSSRSTPPDCRRSFGRSRTATTAARGARRQSGSSAPGLQSLCPPCCSSWTSESQGQSSFPPIVLHHGRDILHYESLLAVEVPETSDAVLMIHNIIRGAHCFWPLYWI